MEVNGKIVDPETGEVLEEGCTATVDFGDGRGPVNMNDKEAMKEGTQEFVGEVLQLTLFEGHKVDLFDVKLKAANLGGGVIGPDTKTPKLYEKRYIMVEMTAVGISHAKKVIEGEPFLLKTATFAITKSKEVDEFTAKRMLTGGEGSQS